MFFDRIVLFAFVYRFSCVVDSISVGVYICMVQCSQIDDVGFGSWCGRHINGCSCPLFVLVFIVCFDLVSGYDDGRYCAVC